MYDPREQNSMEHFVKKNRIGVRVKYLPRNEQEKKTIVVQHISTYASVLALLFLVFYVPILVSSNKDVEKKEVIEVNGQTFELRTEQELIDISKPQIQQAPQIKEEPEKLDRFGWEEKRNRGNRYPLLTSIYEFFRDHTLIGFVIQNLEYAQERRKG